MGDPILSCSCFVCLHPALIWTGHLQLLVPGGAFPFASTPVLAWAFSIGLASTPPLSLSNLIACFSWAAYIFSQFQVVNSHGM